MSDLRITLTTDGPSDEVLLHPLRWLLRKHVSRRTTIQPQWADLRSLRQKPKDLADRIRHAIDLYPCELLFVHRDAETAAPCDRRREMEEAAAAAGISVPFVCVVPLRMSEAWLLFDEMAVRRAAGNPHGEEPLLIPRRDPEAIPNPKDVLHKALQSASGLSRRRLRRFDFRQRVRRVAEYINDFSPLQELSAFRKLEKDLVRVLRENGWT